LFHVGILAQFHLELSVFFVRFLVDGKRGADSDKAYFYGAVSENRDAASNAHVIYVERTAAVVEELNPVSVIADPLSGVDFVFFNKGTLSAPQLEMVVTIRNEVRIFFMMFTFFGFTLLSFMSSNFQPIINLWTAFIWSHFNQFIQTVT
jgi:hypothetical protein